MSKNKERKWGLWFLLPIYPYQQRATIRRELVPDRIWCLEQPHGFLYAVVPIRMTVIKLQQGGLLVYCPIAPTLECIRLVRELEAQHGQVKYIIHSTSSGLEHKIFVGPFARYFPQAEVWCAPSQWSFPLNLPLSWLGFPRNRTYTLPADWRQSPLADEFEYQLIEIKLNAGSFGEVALFHRQSRSLLVTDTVIKIPQKPPAIFELDPFPLLFHARESALDNLDDTPANRLKGWQRICLFALYFRPSMIETMTIPELLTKAKQAPNRSRANYFGLYPFRWQPHWLKSFDAIAKRELPLVAPILQQLILPQNLEAATRWVDLIALWQFEQIIPAHLEAPIRATPEQFRQAFSFTDCSTGSTHNLYPSGYEQILRQDSTFIQQLEATLVKFKIVKPSPISLQRREEQRKS